MIAKARLDATADLAKVKDWINQAYARACVETEANQTFGTMSFTADVSSYTFPSEVVRIKSMYVTPTGGTASVPIRQTTLDFILRSRTAAAFSASGYVTHYALLGINDFEVYPTPSAADTLTIWYVSLPTPLSASNEVPILQEPYASKLLEYGALAEAADFKGDPSDQEYRSLFEDWLRRYRSQITRKAGAQPGQFNFFPAYTFPPHDPSTDVGR